jgi:hypothetical protein
MNQFIEIPKIDLNISVRLIILRLFESYQMFIFNLIIVKEIEVP